MTRRAIPVNPGRGVKAGGGKGSTRQVGQFHQLTEREALFAKLDALLKDQVAVSAS